MKKVCVLTLFILGISVITIAKPSRNNHHKHIRSLTVSQHMVRNNEFKCRHPQQRAIHVKDLIKIQLTDEHFSPSVTVLARCDEYAGCCRKNYVCAPVAMEQVELEVVVTHLIDKNRKQHHEKIIAQNHTRCHCEAEST